MRRTTTSLALAAAALLLAGCGSQSGSDNAGGSKVSPSASSPSSAPSKGGCAPQVELKAADSSRTVCVAKGGEVRLTLKGTKSRPWKPVMVSGSALKGINAGFVLQPGDATAAYHAVAAGTVKLTSSRPLCAEPTAPGQVSCKGIQEWTVTVNVR
ncbi:hypothetical protein [Streptomyces roseochromogenus]|uniref:Lipoprotein n=1 Tax=Streptomyces roseochromogenus subsp. oscitans DS 12.976 TaxID=1352936 RepID=V6K0M3_STRRC|nr:hypothetical protein [Streptomyces roseochromogenus]EST25652.1 hypothetical protein M878_28315 [Streptomyces roseochromogenus subsp. oscitans DS 12.976]